MAKIGPLRQYVDFLRSRARHCVDQQSRNNLQFAVEVLNLERHVYLSITVNDSINL